MSVQPCTNEARVLTLSEEQGSLKITNKTSFPVEVKHIQYDGKHHHYRPYVDGKKLCPYKTDGTVVDNIKFIASKSISFLPIDDTYIMVVERDIYKEKCVKWVDISKVIDSNYYFAMSKKPENLTAETIESSDDEVKEKKPDPIKELVVKVQNFYNELKGSEGIPKEIPEDKQSDYNELVTTTKKLMSEHPFANLDHLNKEQAKLQEMLEESKTGYFELLKDYKELDLVDFGKNEIADLKRVLYNTPLTAFSMDCGGLFKGMEREMRMLLSFYEDVSTLISFLESSNDMESVKEDSFYPTCEAVGRLLKVGFFNPQQENCEDE